MPDIQPPQEILKEILSHFNQDNFLKAETLANTLIEEYSNNIFLLKILRSNPPNDALIDTNEISRKINTKSTCNKTIPRNKNYIRRPYTRTN